VVGFGLILFKCVAQNNTVVPVLEPEEFGRKDQCRQLSLHALEHFGVGEGVSEIGDSLAAL